MKTSPPNITNTAGAATGSGNFQQQRISWIFKMFRVTVWLGFLFLFPLFFSGCGKQVSGGRQITANKERPSAVGWDAGSDLDSFISVCFNANNKPPKKIFFDVKYDFGDSCWNFNLFSSPKEEKGKLQCRKTTFKDTVKFQIPLVPPAGEKVRILYNGEKINGF
jgi:hypothetical protein